MIESEPPTEAQQNLAVDYLVAMRRLKEAEEYVALIRDQLIQAAPAGTIMEVDGYYVTRTVRNPNRKLDVVQLMKRGLKREDFSTVKPSVGVFTEYAEKHRWSEADRDRYIVRRGDPVPTVLVRQIAATEEDRMNYEEN